MQRVAIVGSGGAGKSTLARELGDVLGLPVIHLDRLFWKPGWVPTPESEWRHIQAKALSGDRWIADGNYSATLDLRLARIDTLVRVDRPATHCLVSALTRMVRHYGESIQADRCPERLNIAFLLWIWRYPRLGKKKIDAAIRAYRASGGRPFELVTIASKREARSWLDDRCPHGPR